MPQTLVSAWKKIAQSGPTVDGRFIKPEWLTDMAETYDTAVYTAKIWLDHMRYASYGSVHSLKTEVSGEVVSLFAKICPNRSLLQMNQVWEEYLHFSIEPTEDFAKTGKCYLTGLGMTDSPASLGTEEMRFSNIPGREFTARYPGEQVPDLRESNNDQELERFSQKLFRLFSKTEKPKEENELMDEKQFELLTTTLGSLQQSFSSLAEKFDKITPAEPAAPGGEETPDLTEGADKKQYEDLKAGHKALEERFNALMERIEKVAPGTEFKETTTPAENEEELL
ncbi:MAG: GPO family capsid scaffolding protein [Desulforhopalus sp.]